MTSDRRAGRGIPGEDSWAGAGGQGARWIALNLELRAPHTWLGPSWALLGGALSSANLALQPRTLVMLAVVWLLAEPLLGSLVALSLRIARRRHVRRAGAPVPQWTLPYAEPNAPGQRALQVLARRAARLRLNWRACEGGAERWLLLAAITLALSTVVGGRVVEVVALAMASLAVVAAGRPVRGEGRAVLSAGQFLVAWLAGRGAFAEVDYGALLVGVGFTVAWYAWMRRPPDGRMLATAHAVLGGLLVALGAPLAAGGVLLLAAPLFALWPETPAGQRSYLRHTQAYLMLSLLIGAWGLAWAS